MQFIKNGPDIPERLLQAHEDGKVVFFCGAGISYPAGLPDFKGLVTQLYEKMGEPRNKIQENAIKSGQFDTAIGLLESSDVGERKAVREKLAEILTPSNLTPDATATHRALLTLGKTRKGKMRLITTNFDRIFEEIIQEEVIQEDAKKEDRKEEQRYQAPLLPVPKNHWSGLVYLHGLLPPEPDGERDHLVLSSGDFGLAYLTERWAARFTSELFRNYTVCFVGYSINDSILRYMMDALAADRLRGESSPEIFAFGIYSNGKRDEQAEQWQAKNVTPILYSKYKKHFYLRKTLLSWSQHYRDGLGGKEQIVRSLAHAKPLKSTKEDSFVYRMLWALSDPNGLPAKRFAELNPAPSLDWLDPLSENRYGHNDLGRFGVPQKSTHDNEMTFSFVKRPPPYDKALSMSLVDVGFPNGELDGVMRHLGKWLVRHLDDPKLALWIAKQGGRLHYEFKELIQERLQEYGNLEKNEKQEELELIRAVSPKAIPSPLMRTLWELILSGRLKQSARRDNDDLFRWFEYFNLAGRLTPSLRIELREILTPRIRIYEPFDSNLLDWSLFNGGGEPPKKDAPQRMRDLVEWDIVLSADHIHIALEGKKDKSEWKFVLPDLLADFTLLLREALDLMRELGEAEDLNDRSHFDQPSISEHSQNDTFHDWTALINLTRDAWLAIAEDDTEQAWSIAEGWWKTPYPLFKRLAFFAAAKHEDVIPCQQALNWLLADDSWWLWSVGTQRETMRLLVALSHRLDTTAMNQLEQAILQGPPRKMFRKDIEDEEWSDLVDRTIWRRLARLQSDGVELSQKASSKLDTLKQKHSWDLAKDDQDDFPVWLEPASNIVGEHSHAPQEKDELIEWLRENHKTNILQTDNWGVLCKQKFEITSGALIDLAKQGEWLEDRWGQAFSTWADDELLEKSWDRIPKVIIDAPDSLIGAVGVYLGRWLRKQASKFEGQEEKFFSLIKRILKLEYQDFIQDDEYDPLNHAINHPTGIATEALLNWWYRRSLEDGQGLPDEIRHLLTHICDTKYEELRHGRVILATHVINLFRVDQEWTSMNFLRLFEWQQLEDEARAVWTGFLWSPRFYRPLIAAIKQPFLETAQRYEKLATPPRQYASLLVSAGMDPDETITKKELSNAIRQEGLLSAIAGQLTRGLKGAGEQHVDYWHNRVKPYFRSIWPRSNDFKSPEISASLARLCVAAQKVFPGAYKELRYWLQHLEDREATSIVYKLHNAGLSEQFPEDTLAFLDAIIGEQYQFPANKLRDCLDAILEKRPDLARDRRFQRLSKL